MSYIGNLSTQQAFTPAIDYFSGNGSTVSFTLSRVVASVAQVQCAIENVPQNPSTAFTVSGNTIAFTSAPPSGSNNIYVYYTSPITSVATLTQSPSIVGDVNASGGVYAAGTFNSGYADGAVLDYTTGTGRITVGTADGFKIRNGGPSSPTDLLAVDSSGNVGIGTSSPAVPLHVASTGAYQARFERTSAASSYITFKGTSTVGSNGIGTSGDNVSLITGGTERAVIDSSGNLLVGTTANSWSGDMRMNVRGLKGASFISTGGASSEVLGCWNIADSGTRYQIYFADSSAGGLRGSISTNGSSTTYSTSSDYRLKENVQPMTGALSVVSQLKPCTYTWKADGSNGQGFIAHELQAIVPEAVVGQKDAVDADGNPVYQGIDTSFLVATLTAAIQEQQALIQQLTSRIETLEAK